MDVEITSKKENPLLNRTEVQFTVHHPEANTPTRSDVREQVAALVGANKGLVVVDNLKTVFGRAQTKGYAKVYDSVDALRDVESDHLLKRNGLAAAAEE